MRNQRHLRSLLRGLPLRWRRQKWRGYCVVCSHRTQYWVPTAGVAPCHDLGRHIFGDGCRAIRQQLIHEALVEQRGRAAPGADLADRLRWREAGHDQHTAEPVAC